MRGILTNRGPVEDQLRTRGGLIERNQASAEAGAQRLRSLSTRMHAQLLLKDLGAVSRKSVVEPDQWLSRFFKRFAGSHQPPALASRLETTTVAPDWELVWRQESRNPGTISVDSSIQPYRSTDL